MCEVGVSFLSQIIIVMIVITMIVMISMMVVVIVMTMKMMMMMKIIKYHENIASELGRGVPLLQTDSVKRF